MNIIKFAALNDTVPKIRSGTARGYFIVGQLNVN